MSSENSPTRRGSNTAHPDPLTRMNSNGATPRRGSKIKGPRRSVLLLPKMDHTLEDWLQFPTKLPKWVFFSSITLPFKWLLWNSKGLSSLKPGEDMRQRLCSQSSILGNVAALYLVVAITAFLAPPKSTAHEDQGLISAYGVLMFFAAIALTFYICLSLTVMYPLLESIPDFAAVEAYQNLALRWGGYELFLFNFGCQSVLVALLIGAKVIYSIEVVYCMIVLFIVLYFIGAFMTREFFIAIDPITTLHMGICNCPLTLERAQKLSEVIKRQHHEYLSANDDNRREYRDAHYSENELVRAGEGTPLLDDHQHSEVQSADGGSPHPMSVDWNSSNKSFESVPATAVPLTLTEAVKRVSLLGVSNHKPAFESSLNDAVEAATARADREDSDDDEYDIPSLDEMLLGDRPLLLFANRFNTGESLDGSSKKVKPRSALMSLDDCKNIRHTLVRQGCATTEAFIMLLKWQSQNLPNINSPTAKPTPAARRATFVSTGAKTDLNHCVTVCVQLGIPMFHAMMLVDFLKPHL